MPAHKVIPSPPFSSKRIRIGECACRRIGDTSHHDLALGQGRPHPQAGEIGSEHHALAVARSAKALGLLGGDNMAPTKTNPRPWRGEGAQDSTSGSHSSACQAITQRSKPAC